MKVLIFGVIFCGWLACGTFLVQAQTNAAATSASAQQAVSFLTPAQQEQYAKARAQALTDNPTLKSEGEDLMKQGQTVMASGTAAGKQAFMEQMNSHRQKLRAAMLKVDPTLEPIFAEIDKHISEIKAKQQAGGAK